jgi:putative transcriptional regulator
LAIGNFASRLRERMSAHSVFRPVRVRSRLQYLASLTAIAGLVALGAGLTGTKASIGAAVAAEAAGLTGQFLVATDELQDPRFIRTVVYVVHHDAGGAMGLIVNRPIGDASLADLLERLGMEGKGINGEILVHFGGPVEPAQGFVLHTTDYATGGTQVVKDGIAVTSQPEILRAIGTGTGPRKSLFALGYAGWSPGQLEGEIKAGAWVVVPADEALVFDEHYEKKWERAMARRTINL